MSVKMNRTKDWQKVPLPDSSLNLPIYVGKWEMGKGNKFYFFTLKKPNWFHRKMTHLLLGWIWHDNS